MVTTKKTPAKKVVAKKAPAKKVAAKTEGVAKATPADTKPKVSKTEGHAKPAAGKYIFATGRRKTSIANVRLFAGTGDIVINKKAFNVYFPNKPQQDTALRPLAVTGLAGEYYFVAHVSGGGKMSQVGAVRHGVAQALAKLNSDLQNVLKKNGFLTRDDRKKERKKPGLRGARRAPQWAKR
jgi:small subunit ribosomal protein S9